MNPNDLLKTRRERRREEVKLMCRQAWHENKDLWEEGRKLDIQDQIYWKAEMDAINADPFNKLLNELAYV